MPREVQQGRRPVPSVTALGLLALILLGGLAALCARRQGAADVRTQEEARQKGRALFEQGVTASGAPLKGLLGEDAVELTGREVACSNCHGPQGRGSQEGGLVVPDVRARTLFAPAPERGLPGAPVRPAYTRESLARALREGHAAGGRALDFVMPRFPLTEEDLTHLLAWLQVLDTAREPGVHPDRLVLGTALPLTGPQGAVGRAVQEVLAAALMDVNQQGGLYGRRLELRVEDAALGDATARLLEADVFALVGSVRAAASPAEARLEQEGVPLVGPVGLSDGEEGRMVFSLFSGPRLQARAAVQHVHTGWDRTQGPPPRLAVLHGATPQGEAWARGAREEAQARGLPLQVLPLAAPVQPTRARAVLFDGPLEALAALAASLPPDVTLYAPGLLARPGAAERWPSLTRVHFVSPTAAGEEAQAQAAALAAFLARHGLTPQRPALQAAALASARLTLEALRRSGAEPTRAGLVAALESVQELATGVSPPLTYGAGNRVGVRAARLVQLEAGSGGLRPLSGWLALSR